MHDNIFGLIDHQGPYFEHWRERCRAAFGVALPEQSETG